MSFIENQLKNINPVLIWQKEEKIKKTILFLERNGFRWEETKKIFYNKKTDIVIDPEDFGKILENTIFFYEKVGKEKDLVHNKRRDCLEDVRIAGIVINFLVFLIIMNFFLGWIILNIYFWFFLEATLVFFLGSFVKIRNKIKKNVN
jgi:hypothetical protein